MDTFDEHYKRLESLLAGWDLPKWKNILYIEDFNLDSSLQQSVKTINLYSQDIFSDHFRSIMARGFSWINLSVLGLLNDTLIISVEKPKKYFPGTKTSVNLSGPSNFVKENNYQLDKFINLESAV